MNPYSILVGVLLFVASLTGAYFKGRHDESMQQVERQRDGLIAYAERIKKGEEQHDEDQAVINNLAADNKRLRVHIPRCPTIGDQGGESGLFSARVDEEFGKLQSRAGELFQRCDQLNIDAIRMNSVLFK